MAIQEITIDPKTGVRTGRLLPGYEDRPRHRAFPKEQQMKSKIAAKAKPVEIKKPVKAVKRAKLDFSITVMALNDDRVLSKTKQEEIEDESTLVQTFSRWVKSGAVGGFYTTRRK